MASILRDRHVQICAVLLLIGFLLRLGFALQLTGNLLSDSIGYDLEAVRLVEENRFYHDEIRETYHPPGYAFFLSLIYRVFGLQNYLAVQIIQCLLGTLTAYLVYDITRLLAGKRSALFALAVFVFLRSQIFLSALLLTESLYLPLMLVFFRICIAPVDRMRVSKHLFAGICAGLATLTRPELLPMVFVIAGGTVLRHGWRPERKLVLPALALLVGCGMVVGSWTVRNAFKYHALVPVSTMLGRTLYEGNRPPTALGIQEFRDAHTHALGLSELEEDQAFRNALRSYYVEHWQFYLTRYYPHKFLLTFKHLFANNSLWFPLDVGKDVLGPRILGLEWRQDQFSFQLLGYLRIGSNYIPVLTMQVLFILMALGLLFIPVRTFSFYVLSMYLLMGFFWIFVVLFAWMVRFRVAYEPVALVIAAVGLANAPMLLKHSLKTPLLRLAVAALVVTLTTFPLLRISEAYGRFERTAQAFKARSQPGDLVILADDLRHDFRWWLVPPPESTVVHASEADPGGNSGAAALKTMAAGRERVWLVLGGEDAHIDAYAAALGPEFAPVDAGADAHCAWALYARQHPDPPAAEAPPEAEAP